MRALLIALLAVALSACATPPAPAPAVPLAGHSSTGLVSFGTLAEFGTWEMSLAPVYTRLAGLIHRAARLKESGRLDADAEHSVRSKAIEAKALLDESKRGNRVEPTPTQRIKLDAAIALTNEIAAQLEKLK